MSDQKKVTLKDEVLNLSKEIRVALSVDDNGTVSGETDKVYEKNLPNGFTMDSVKELSEYNTTFVAAGTHAVGQLAVEAMEKNKGLEAVSAELPFGHKDTINIGVQRKRESVVNFGDNKGDTVVKFGATTVAVKTRAGHNAGELSKARKLINELAADALDK